MHADFEQNLRRAIEDRTFYDLFTGGNPAYRVLPQFHVVDGMPDYEWIFSRVFYQHENHKTFLADISDAIARMLDDSRTFQWGLHVLFSFLCALKRFKVDWTQTYDWRSIIEAKKQLAGQSEWKSIIEKGAHMISLVFEEL